MSDQIERFSDPGLPEHIHRKADTDPAAADKAERQIAILFLLSALGTVIFIFSYIKIPNNRFVFLPVLGSTNAQQLLLGIGLTFSTLFIGLGAVHWAKTLMPDNEVIQERHEFRSEEVDRIQSMNSAIWTVERQICVPGTTFAPSARVSKLPPRCQSEVMKTRSILVKFVSI